MTDERDAIMWARKPSITEQKRKPNKTRLRSFRRFLVVKLQEVTAERDQYEAHSQLLRRLVKALLTGDVKREKNLLEEAVAYLYNGKRVPYKYNEVFKQYLVDRWDKIKPEGRKEMIRSYGVAWETFRRWYYDQRGVTPRVGKTRFEYTDNQRPVIDWKTPDVGEKCEIPTPPKPKEVQDAGPRTYQPDELYEKI